MAGSAEKVSVIIPCHNYGRYLGETIDSALRQKFDKIQIIVVDDGSTDNTRQIVDGYTDKVEYIYQDNQGLSAARNTGIGLARGEYIQFLDSDDILGANALSGRISVLDENPDVGLAVCRNHYFSSIVDGEPKLLFASGWPLYKNNLNGHLYFLNIAPPHAFLVRKSVVTAVGLFDEEMKVCEDYDYWARAVIKGFKIKHSKDGVVYYRKHAGSMSNNRQRQFKYDTRVHTKLLNNLSTDENTRENEKFSRLLALLAGTLFLLYRIDESELRVSQELSTHYERIIDLLENISKCNNLEWSALSYMYYLRALYEARHAMHVGKISKQQYMSMINSVSYFDTRAHKLSKWMLTLKYAAGKENIGWLERYRMLKYSL